MPSLNRIVMQRSSRQMIQELDPPSLDVAEVSGKWGQVFNFKSYRRFFFFYHDICTGPYLDDDGKPLKFDLIMANQVWEHLDRPYGAVKNVRRMLKKGGHFWIAVPFFCRFTQPQWKIHVGPRAG